MKEIGRKLGSLVLLGALVLGLGLTESAKAQGLPTLGCISDKVHRYVVNSYIGIAKGLGYGGVHAPEDTFLKDPEEISFTYDALLIVGTKNIWTRKEYDAMRKYVEVGGVLIVETPGTWKIGEKDEKGAWTSVIKTPKGAIPDVLGADQPYPSPHYIGKVKIMAEHPITKGFKPGEWFDLSSPAGSAPHQTLIFKVTTGASLLKAQIYKTHYDGETGSWLPGEKEGFADLLVVHNYGKGKAICIRSEMGRNATKHNEIVYEKLLKNMINWVLGGKNDQEI